MDFSISNFCPVLNVVGFLLGNSPASEFYMPTFRNTLSVPTHLWRWNRQSLPKSWHKIQTPGDLPKRKHTSIRWNFPTFELKKHTKKYGKYKPKNSYKKPKDIEKLTIIIKSRIGSFDPFRLQSYNCSRQRFFGLPIVFLPCGCDVEFKLAKFLQLTGTIRKTIFRKVWTETILKIYSTLVMPKFLYGSENWTRTTLQRRRTEAAEIKLLRPLAGYTLYDHKTNYSVRRKLQTEYILDK
jgi:hypothetical protein